jgi:hypothetical protein
MQHRRPPLQKTQGWGTLTFKTEAKTWKAGPPAMGCRQGGDPSLRLKNGCAQDDAVADDCVLRSSLKTCQDPKVDGFYVRHSFGGEYKLAEDDTITPFNLIF